MATSKAKTKEVKDKSGWWKPIALTALLSLCVWGYTSTNNKLDKALDHLENHQDRIVRLEVRSDFQESRTPLVPTGD